MTSLPDPLQSLTPKLEHALRERVEASLAQNIKMNSKTIFYRESTLLSAFRSHVGDQSPDVLHHPGGMDDRELVQTFYSTVPLSLYDAYEPFISRFLAKPECTSSSVRDLLSPGLPEFLAQTSGTSGLSMKLFPKYPLTRTVGYIPTAVRFCAFTSLGVSSVVKISSGQDDVKIDIAVCNVSSGSMRHRMGVTLKDGDEFMSRKDPFSPIPFAVWCIPSSPGSYLLTFFFAVMDPSLVFIRASFTSNIYDAIRLLEEHWDTVVEAVEKGTVPTTYDLGRCRPFLEVQAQVKPNPSRAAELRSIRQGGEGWLGQIWPSLKVVRASASGGYANFVPKIRYHFGPQVDIESYTYASTECVIGYGYDPVNDHNLYRVHHAEHFEYLDVSQPESIQGLRQAWELQSGQKYEIVATTKNGLWRYRIRDVVEVGGFDPSDGQPIIRFVERRGVGFRIAGEHVPEKMIRDAINLTRDSLGCVLEFIVELDDRRVPRSYGFFVELDGVLGPDPRSAPRKVHDFLLTNAGYNQYTQYGRIGIPTIRVVAPRTFMAYREWRMKVTGCLLGQVKVPTTTIDIATKEWLAGRVILELGG